uniref:ORF42 n=1 Tax=Malaco herpesvirus 2 TaxID=3031798 RepID=A0AA48P807_9VIRU|nr:TPA_asm: ORF42 [Malaco herpesvirus 2]
MIYCPLSIIYICFLIFRNVKKLVHIIWSTSSRISMLVLHILRMSSSRYTVSNGIFGFNSLNASITAALTQELLKRSLIILNISFIFFNFVLKCIMCISTSKYDNLESSLRKFTIL